MSDIALTSKWHNKIVHASDMLFIPRSAKLQVEIWMPICVEASLDAIVFGHGSEKPCEEH